MKYVLLILLISCNSSYDKKIAKQVPRSTFVDSVSKTLDSFKLAVADFKEVSDFAQDAQSEIKRLEKENSLLEKYDFKYSPKFDSSIKLEALSYAAPKESNYNIDLLKRLRELEAENARLKKRIYQDSMYHVRTDKDIVPNEIETEKPNDKSLIITLDKKLRGDGDISETGVSVWIMDYNKESKKIMKTYLNCQQKDLNLLNAKEASYYEGQYFFNDIQPGKYLVKVCALYGNWMVVNKKDYKQEIKMLMSPPIQ